jgi:uncharacterized ion transporter superfamily protein YfcC
MEQRKAGAQISRKAFMQSLLILFALMLAAGALTRFVPAGSYVREVRDGRETILSGSFIFNERPAYPAWRWFTAPLEVLGGSDGLTVIVIILFIVMVGVAFAVLDKSGLLRAAITRIVQAFGDKKYMLLLAVSFFFMTLGAFFGIFEEVVPLVPLMVALAYSLGWDALTGLGMSILATNMGFSAAITNPFTIGVAQRLAGLPPFSGAGYRILIFLVMYLLLAVFLTRYARSVERRPESSPVYAEDRARRGQYETFDLQGLADETPRFRGAMLFLGFCLGLILALLVLGPFVPFLMDIALPAVGLLFLIGGLGAGFISGAGRSVWRAAGEGAAGIAPAIPLILMAASVKHIVAAGGILDTLLYSASGAFNDVSPTLAANFIYLITLGLEFFVSSGSAKAFLLMPIIVPLADLVGVTRQVAVTAYCFGDGFSNLAYPTSAVLLICLGLTSVSYPKWLKWVLGLWIWVILLSIVFLAIGVLIGYGPF